MGFISGEKLLIKIGDGADPEQFDTIGGIRTSTITVRNEVIVQNDVDSGKWQQLAEDSGISEVVIAGIGFFTDSDAEETLRNHSFNRKLNNYEFDFGNGNTLKGSFMVSEYQREGDIRELNVFSIVLNSSGMVEYV